MLNLLFAFFLWCLVGIFLIFFYYSLHILHILFGVFYCLCLVFCFLLFLCVALSFCFRLFVSVFLIFPCPEYFSSYSFILSLFFSILLSFACFFPFYSVFFFPYGFSLVHKLCERHMGGNTYWLFVQLTDIPADHRPLMYAFSNQVKKTGCVGFGVLGSEYTDKSFSEYIMKCFQELSVLVFRN